MKNEAVALPRGFALERGEPEESVIRYRTTGMGCAMIFLLFWLSGWSYFCAVLTYAALFPLGGKNLWLLLPAVPFWAVEIFLLNYVAWWFFSVTRFRFRTDELMIEETLIGWRRRTVIPRNLITAVKQIKDGGEGDDSFPSWGLQVLAPEAVSLLSRQPLESSDWLGPVVANWAGVPYIPDGPSEADKIKVP